MMFSRRRRSDDDPSQQQAPSAFPGDSQDIGAREMGSQRTANPARSATTTVTPTSPTLATASNPTGQTQTVHSGGTGNNDLSGPFIHFSMEPRTDPRMIGRLPSRAIPSFLQRLIWDQLKVDQRYLWYFGLDRSHYDLGMNLEKLFTATTHDLGVVLRVFRPRYVTDMNFLAGLVKLHLFRVRYQDPLTTPPGNPEQYIGLNITDDWIQWIDEHILPYVPTQLNDLFLEIMTNHRDFDDLSINSDDYSRRSESSIVSRRSTRSVSSRRSTRSVSSRRSTRSRRSRDSRSVSSSAASRRTHLQAHDVNAMMHPPSSNKHPSRTAEPPSSSTEPLPHSTTSRATPVIQNVHTPTTLLSRATSNVPGSGGGVRIFRLMIKLFLQLFFPLFQHLHHGMTCGCIIVRRTRTDQADTPTK